jgi:hypothetical protein
MTSTFSAIQVNNFTRGNGINTRLAVKYTSTGTDINLSLDLLGTVLDGGTLLLNDRILLKDQTNPRQNGIYVIKSGAGLTIRAPDLGTGDNASFIFLHCQIGTINKNTTWVQVNVPPNISTAVDYQPQLWVASAIYNYMANSMFYATSSSTLGVIAPVPNSVLVSDGAGVPSWGAGGGGGSVEKNITISAMQIIAYSPTPLPIGYFDWVNYKYIETSRSVFYESTVPDTKSLTVSVYNETTDPSYTTPLGTQTLIGPITTPGTFNNFTFSIPGGTSSFTGYIGSGLGTIADTTLTVLTLASGIISVGQIISGGTTITNTYIIDQLTGTPGGVGTYTVSVSQAVVSPTVTTGTGSSARLAICVNKTHVGGVNPSVYGVTMILTP